MSSRPIWIAIASLVALMIATGGHNMVVVGMVPIAEDMDWPRAHPIDRLFTRHPRHGDRRDLDGPLVGSGRGGCADRARRLRALAGRRLGRQQQQ